MHSKIFQVSNKPISEDEYASPLRYSDNSSDFADYIGDPYNGVEREEAIGYLSDLLEDVFEHKGGGEFAYKGQSALTAFKKKWALELLRPAGMLTPDNLFKEQNLFRIRKTTEETHLRSSYRVDIKDWCDGIAYPFGELFEYADSKLKKGDCIYIGAVIDYHF